MLIIFFKQHVKRTNPSYHKKSKYSKFNEYTFSFKIEKSSPAIEKKKTKKKNSHQNTFPQDIAESDEFEYYDYTTPPTAFTPNPVSIPKTPIESPAFQEFLDWTKPQQPQADRRYQNTPMFTTMYSESKEM